MKLTYENKKDEGVFVFTNFNCGPSMRLLHKKGYYKILWAKSGPADIVIDGYQLRLEQNQMAFCTPLNIVQFEQNPGLIAIVFNREFYCIRDHDTEVSCNGFLFFGSSMPQMLGLSKNDIPSFDAMFLMFKEELETTDSIQGEMLRVLLKRLLIKATRIIKSQSDFKEFPEAQFDIVRKYHILVEQHFREKHKVADYAELLFKSPKTLANLFKKSGDKSPLKIINERILSEAKRLLLFSDKTAEEIAFELGFTEASHFSKFFKSHTGNPPGSFKKLQQTQA